MILLGKTLILF